MTALALTQRIKLVILHGLGLLMTSTRPLSKTIGGGLNKKLQASFVHPHSSLQVQSYI